MFSTNKQKGYQCCGSFLDLRVPSQINSNEPYMKIPCNDSLVASGDPWGSASSQAVKSSTGIVSAKSGEELMNVKEHSWQVSDIQLRRDVATFVTASKLFDSILNIRRFTGNRACPPSQL